jgi:hypothetical protein
MLEKVLWPFRMQQIILNSKSPPNEATFSKILEDILYEEYFVAATVEGKATMNASPSV